MIMKICRIELDNEFEADVFIAMIDEESIMPRLSRHEFQFVKINLPSIF